MTCEIAALNCRAIALAADRKVSWKSEGEEHLHRDTEQKLFPLSEMHPVGIMINGNGNCADFGPWDVLIREYVADKKDACHATIGQWADDFLSFIGSYDISKKDEEGGRLEIALEQMFEVFEETAEISANTAGIDLAVDWDCAIEAKIRKLNAKGAVMSPAEVRSVRKHHSDVIDFVVGNRDQYASDRRLLKKATALAWKMVTHGEYSKFASGVAIGGFGSAQRFPALAAFDIDGYLGGTLKCGATHWYDLNQHRGAALTSFAQADMIRAFMSGADEFAERFVFQNLTKELMACLDDSASMIGLTVQQKSLLHERFAVAYQNLGSSFEEEKNKRGGAVVRSINQLDGEALGMLAQSLVALEAMRHFYGDFPPSVGGGCDVLVMRHTDRRVSVKRAGPGERLLI